MSLDFDLPNFDDPESKPQRISIAAYDSWILQNFADLRRDGRLAKCLQRRPMPIGERFRLTNHQS